jgi:hypothetical protein
MDSVRIDVQGALSVGLRFDRFPDALYDDLKREIEALSAELLARVEAATPSRTGRLRSKERVRLFTDPGSIKGQVFIDAGKVSGGEYAKAAALEYGETGEWADVKRHDMLLDHVFARKLVAPTVVLVAAFARVPNIEEHAFERGPLAAMQPEVQARLNAVVEKAAAEANA